MNRTDNEDGFNLVEEELNVILHKVGEVLHNQARAEPNNNNVEVAQPNDVEVGLPDADRVRADECQNQDAASLIF